MALFLVFFTVKGMAQIVNQPAMTDSKSFYTLNIETHHVAYELLINDIPVLKQSDETSGAISGYPINPWLINGCNTFRINLLPVETSLTDPEDIKSYSVIITGPREGRRQETPIARAEAVVSDSQSGQSTEVSFTIALSYPQPRWAESEKIGKDSATQNRILEKYREFHRLLVEKDLDGIMRFSEAKFQEYAKSLYAPDFISEKRADFQEDFANPPGYLIDIDVQAENGLRYEYYHHDHLVSIKNDEDRSIIMYYNDDSGVTTSYPLCFYFDGTDFILIL